MIHVGDCLQILPTLPAASVDSIVTDPPYGLGFMGKAWDHQVPGVPFWEAMLRIAKPGAHLAAFGGTRTFHRMACAIEDAGWEIRDTLMWMYGSGFPKSHNGDWGGTALKPAWEPIILARKPLAGTVAANHDAYGTGGLDIDGCRVGTRAARPLKRNTSIGFGGSEAQGEVVDGGKGRWPANVAHDGSDEVLAGFPESVARDGATKGAGGGRTRNTYGVFTSPEIRASAMRRDAGSAARFFYCAKASREDRNAGCESLPERALHWSAGDQSPGTFQGEATHKAARNNHPTVKPTDLMRWLVRLVTPAGGIVLDPFTGSGSTGRAAAAEGMEFIGIELDPDYARIAEARIRATQPGLALGALA